MSENQTTTSWGSRLGFILASAGSAVGLGAIWKFPYMAGTNGGSVFMLPYIFFTFTVGISLLVAEFAMGRAGREGPMASLTKVCGRGWGFFGGVGVFTVFLILSFYSGVGGWCIKYMVDAVIGRGLISDPELLGTHFGAFVSDGSMSFLYMMIFLGITSVVVLRGIQGGIERVAKVLMPALFILMLIIIVRPHAAWRPRRPRVPLRAPLGGLQRLRALQRDGLLLLLALARRRHDDHLRLLPESQGRPSGRSGMGRHPRHHVLDSRRSNGAPRRLRLRS